MESIVEVKPLDNYHVWIKFADNFSATINIKPFVTTGISSKLSDIDYFKQVRIDPFGGITWENGFDFCPKVLRDLSQEQVIL